MTEEIDKKFNYIVDRMSSLEQHVIYENLKNVMNQPLKIDDRGIRRIVSDFAEEFDKFTKQMKEINLKELIEAIKSSNMKELNGMMQYQANRLKGIEERLTQIEKNAPERKVRVEVFVAGENKEGESLDLKEQRALDCLEEKDILILKYRTKWIDGAHTYKALGEKVKISQERVRMRYIKSLRKLKNHQKIDSLESIMPKKSFEILLSHLGTIF